jgi:hypothetical protein
MLETQNRGKKYLRITLEQLAASLDLSQEIVRYRVVQNRELLDDGFFDDGRLRRKAGDTVTVTIELEYVLPSGARTVPG